MAASKKMEIEKRKNQIERGIERVSASFMPILPQKEREGHFARKAKRGRKRYPVVLQTLLLVI
jgi:hypothetical protein